MNRAAILGALLAIASPARAANTAIVPLKPLTTLPTQALSLAKPDLAITKLAVDGNCRIAVTVVNHGPGKLPDSVWAVKTPSSSGVYITVGGKGWGGGTIWSFDSAQNLKKAGGSAAYVSSYVVQGSVSVQATVDHTAQVAETNEGNNGATATLTCGSVPLVQIPTGAIKAFASPGSATGGETPPEPEYSGEESYYYDDSGTSQGPMPPSGGGSLLGAALPPPPQNLPPVPPKEAPDIEPGELIVVSPSMAEAQALAAQLQSLGLGVKRRTALSKLGLVISVLRVPKDAAVGTALAGLRETLPKAWADANHRYELLGDETRQYGTKLIGWSGSATCGKGLRIGLLDSAVDANHPALRGSAIMAKTFLAAGIPTAAPDHGTATAALLLANPAATGPAGMLPAAQLYSANIFRDRGRKQVDTTAEWIALALDWLASQNVSIINMSLGGPRNLLVEAAVQRVQQRGIAVVAAAGNSGEKSPPAFPAAQAGVIAVTAVDASLEIYRHASRGDYIAFSAPGVDIWTAAPGKDGIYVSGTSYAAPFVTAALASARLANPKASWPALLKQLQQKSRDLGTPGRDAVFGWGLVQSGGCMAAKQH
ncbi:MAG: S8 family serine peptidase [Sulfuricaulis sp.]|uniref:S8 family serine peptidase n=1 Tax=Sulfuricaulis sp. TaxID=2003553 RepID=UPI0025F94575|nr:S8 family serine peptidase [Sulfuricaulis sp.]MCR4345583.1 S8 family serine peptidase [Sulfuricaulis sp.]